MYEAQIQLSLRAIHDYGFPELQSSLAVLLVKYNITATSPRFVPAKVSCVSEHSANRNVHAKDLPVSEKVFGTFTSPKSDDYQRGKYINHKSDNMRQAYEISLTEHRSMMSGESALFA